MGNLGRKILTACRNRLFDRPIVCFFSTAQARVTTLPVRYTLSFPALEDLPKIISALPGGEKQQALYRARFEAGDQVCVVSHNGDLAHVSWFGVRQYLDADYELGPNHSWALEHPAALIYDCWTAPQQRGQGLYPTILGILSAKLLQDNPEVWIYCLIENKASRRGIEKAGFAYRGQLKSWRFFGVFY